MIKTTALHVHYAFSTFLWRSLHYYDVKPPYLTCYGGLGHSNLFLNLNKILKNLTPGKVACIWHFERVQIDAIKFERTQIHFLPAFLLPSSSSLLKVPNSRRVRTHEKNSGDAVRQLGTIIQSIFCAQSGASIRLTVWKWSGESRYPGAFPPVLENFCRVFSPGPTDRPWVSEDE